jgi:hypothetical protein
LRDLTKQSRLPPGGIDNSLRLWRGNRRSRRRIRLKYPEFDTKKPGVTAGPMTLKAASN